jgi:hypothetical protein
MARKPNIVLVMLSLLLLVTLTGFLRLGSLMVRDFGFLSSRVSGPQKDFDLDFQRTFDVSKDDQVVIYLCLWNSFIRKPVSVALQFYESEIGFYVLLSSSIGRWRSMLHL